MGNVELERQSDVVNDIDVIENKLDSNNPCIFIAFKSINKITYIIYTNSKNDIIAYNLINNKKISEIKEAHKKEITKLHYYLDESNRRELIMSISKKSNNIKIWDLKDWQCIKNYRNINSLGNLISACFLKDNKETYIVTSNYSRKCSEALKLYDLKGNKIKEIYDSDEDTFFVDVYYGEKIYLLVGNKSYVKTYDYFNDKLYHQYSDTQNCQLPHTSIIITKKEGKIILIESTCRYIRIWNFHAGIILNRISSDKYIESLCLWNSNHLFVGHYNGIVRLLELNDNKFIENIIITDDSDYSIIIFQKINHPQYGECLLCKTKKDESIAIIVNNNESNSFHLFKKLKLD